MLARLCFGLVLGLIMYMPRPRGPESMPPTGPPGSDDFPTPGDDVPPEIDILPMPQRHRHPEILPDMPPTPPPGYEGEWPPATSGPDAPPPTPPPGHVGPWPGSPKPSIIEQLRELIRSIRELGPTDGAVLRDAQQGADDLEPRTPLA